MLPCICLGEVSPAQVGVRPQLYADNLKCLSGNPDLLMHAARFTTGYVRLVGQEPAPSKCLLLSTSREVRKDMKGWFSLVRVISGLSSLMFVILGGHLDTTFRGWSSTLAARVRLVISRLVLIFVLLWIFMEGSSRPFLYLLLLCMESKPLCSLLIACGSFVLLYAGWSGLVDSLLLMLALSLAFWMGLLVVILPFVLYGSVSVTSTLSCPLACGGRSGLSSA